MVYTLTVQSLEAEITSMFRPSTAMPLTGRAWATENDTSHQSHTHSYTFIVSHKPLGLPNSPRWIPDCMLNISTWPVFIPIIAKLPQEVIVTHCMVATAHVVSYQPITMFSWYHMSSCELPWAHMISHDSTWCSHDHHTHMSSNDRKTWLDQPEVLSLGPHVLTQVCVYRCYSYAGARCGRSHGHQSGMSPHCPTDEHVCPLKKEVNLSSAETTICSFIMCVKRN